MKALVKDNKVVDVAIEEFMVHSDFYWIDCPEDCIPGWLVENYQAIRPVVPQKTNQEIIDEFKALIKYQLNNKALERNYDSHLSCISYVNSDNVIWKAEAQAFSSWRDAVYEYALAILNAVQDGNEEAPTQEQFVSGFPIMQWPS